MNDTLISSLYPDVEGVWWHTESRHRFAVDLLNCLDKLPVDYTALKGGIGKTVSKLKKHEQGAVKQLAGGLVSRWKAVAAAGKPKDPAACAGGKRDRSLMTTEPCRDSKTLDRLERLGYCRTMLVMHIWAQRDFVKGKEAMGPHSQ